MLKVAFGIDDVCPTPGYGGYKKDLESIYYLQSIYPEIKFTFFSSIYYEKPGDWQQFLENLSSVKNVEFAYHGYSHISSKNLTTEFDDSDFICDFKLKAMLESWTVRNIFPKGFKFPGWAVNLSFRYFVEQNCKYFAIHPLNYSEYPTILNWTVPKISFNYSLGDPILPDLNLCKVLILHCHAGLGSDNHLSRENIGILTGLLSVYKQDQIEFCYYSDLI